MLTLKEENRYDHLSEALASAVHIAAFAGAELSKRTDVPPPEGRDPRVAEITNLIWGNNENAVTYAARKFPVELRKISGRIRGS